MKFDYYSAATLHAVPVHGTTGIFVPAFGRPPWNEDWTNESAEAYLRERMSGSFSLVTVSECDQIVGFGLGIPLRDYPEAESFSDYGVEIASAFYIAELCTADGHEGRGLCHRYTAALIDSVRGGEYSSVVVRTRFDNVGAIRVFKDLGLRHAGEQVATTGGKPSTRVVYVGELQ